MGLLRTPPFLVLVLVLVLAAAAAVPARAHILPVSGVTPFVEDGTLIGGGTSWGVLLRDDDGVFRRVCEEALGIPVAFLRTAEGRVLIGRAERGLVVTSDGCAPERVAGVLEEHAVSALVSVPSAPDRVLATTATTGADNGVFASDDGGHTFEPTSLSVGGQLFFQLLVSEDGQLVVASGLDTTTQQIVLAVSKDSAVTFDTPAADLGAYAFVKPLAIDQAGAVLLAAVDAQGTHHLLRSIDGLASVFGLASFDGAILGLAEASGGRFALVRSQADGKGIYRQATEGAPFVRLEGGPSACLLNLPGDARLWGCGEEGQAGHFFVSDDGETWEPLVPFDAVEERCCDEGTPGNEQCAIYFAASDGGEPSCSVGGSGDTRDGGPGARSEPPPECSCATTTTTRAPGALLFGLLAGVLVGSRRRARFSRAPWRGSRAAPTPPR